MGRCLLALAALVCCLGACAASQYDLHPDEASTSWFEGEGRARAVAATSAAAAPAGHCRRRAGRRAAPHPRAGFFTRFMVEPADSALHSLALIVARMPNAQQQGWNATLLTLVVQSARHARRLPPRHLPACHADAAPVLSCRCCHCRRSPAEPAPAVHTRTNVRLEFLGAGGSPPTAQPSFSAPPNFTLVAPEDDSFLFHMSGEACSIHARFGALQLFAACAGPPTLWSADGYGPEGAAGGKWGRHPLPFGQMPAGCRCRDRTQLLPTAPLPRRRAGPLAHRVDGPALVCALPGHANAVQAGGPGRWWRAGGGGGLGHSAHGEELGPDLPQRLALVPGRQHQLGGQH